MKQKNPDSEPGCSHPNAPHNAPIDERAVERAARLFRAMGDPQRLALLQQLAGGERCVSELVAASGEKFPTVSARLRVLRTEGLICRRRKGLHVHYSLADDHVSGLIANALAHARELNHPPPQPFRGRTMSCDKHAHGHEHTHGSGCGHTAVKHGDHTDYLHDGHLHHTNTDGSVEEHTLAVDSTNPAACTPGHTCGGHDTKHVHGPGCGHEAVPHGDHTDYLVNGHLHHPHGDHCDDHGPVSVVK